MDAPYAEIFQLTQTLWLPRQPHFSQRSPYLCEGIQG